jgi:hypothetical protein
LETTTLIFGAGVSMAYGYPSGGELVECIIKKLSTRGQHEKNCAETIRGVNPYSIDAFLKERPDLAIFVKPIIVEIILELENPGFTISGKDDANQDHLYKFLFNSVEEFSQLRIITFNYDRSFEYYLINYLKHRFPNDPKMRNDKFHEMKIEHIHGRLPYLQFEPLPLGVRNPIHLDYGLPMDPRRRQDHLSLGTNPQFSNFKTIHENSDANETAQKFISESNRIFFLGFGYHDMNMGALGFDFTKKVEDKLIAGTLVRVGGAVIERRIRDQYLAFEQRFRNQTIMEFFRNTISLTDTRYDKF